MAGSAGPLTGKVTLVTGAARGIGLAVAEALHASGAQVWLVARSADVLATEADRLGRRAHAHACDLTAPEQRERLLDQLLATHGRLDVLVHSAGTIALGPVADTPADVLREQVDSNLVAPYALTRLALPALLGAQGDVVFIGSSVSRVPGAAGKAQYAASHHGLRAFAEALREEVNPEGVRVTFLHVGQTATPRQAALYAAAGRDYRADRLLQPSDVAAVALGALLLPRTAEVTELSVRPRIKP